MKIRTQIAVYGCSWAVFQPGISDLCEEFSHRPWMGEAEVRWESLENWLVIDVLGEGEDPNEIGLGVLDEVTDCIFATIPFGDETVGFQILTSHAVE